MKKIRLIGGKEVDVKHTSEQFTVGWKDGLKALLIAVGTPVIEYVIEALQNGWLADIDWSHAVKIGLSAGLIYLTKNYFTQSAIVIDKKELAK